MLHRTEAETLKAKINDLETHESDLNTQVSTLNITLKEKDVMIGKLQDRLENMKDDLTGGPWSVISKTSQSSESQMKQTLQNSHKTDQLREHPGVVKSLEHS